MGIKYNVAALSRTGIVRERNEDKIFINSKIRLFGVCDGMGGLKYGKETAEMVSEYFRQHSLIDDSVISYSKISKEQVIQEIILDIDQRIAFRNYSWYVRYGCTLCGVWIINNHEAMIFNLGDSRCYIFKSNAQEGKLLTRDHNQASELCNENETVSISNSQNALGKNILTKYIGNPGSNEPDIIKVNYQNGDRFLICTDGLYNELQEKEIDNIMYNYGHKDITETSKNLVEESIVAGGRDNISVVLIEFKDESGGL